MTHITKLMNAWEKEKCSDFRIYGCDSPSVLLYRGFINRLGGGGCSPAENSTEVYQTALCVEGKITEKESRLGVCLCLLMV